LRLKDRVSIWSWRREKADGIMTKHKIDKPSGWKGGDTRVEGFMVSSGLY
jgi:hypothetical protein